MQIYDLNNEYPEIYFNSQIIYTCPINYLVPFVVCRHRGHIPSSSENMLCLRNRLKHKKGKTEICQTFL